MKDILNKEKYILIILVTMYVISFVSFINLNILRYLSIFLIHIIGLIKIDFKKICVDKKLYLLFVILVFSMLPSVIVSPYLFDSISKIVTVLDLIIMTNILLPNILKEKDCFKILELINNTIFVILVLLFVIFHNDYSISYDMNRVGNLIRLKSGFNHPNTLASFAFINLTFIIYKFLIKNFKKSDILKFVFVIFLIIKSGSRTSLYVTIIFIMTYFVILFLGSKKRRLAFNLLILIAVVILAFGFIFKAYNISYNDLNRLLSYRLDYINKALSELINKHLLFTGKGAFKNSSLNSVDGVLIDNGYFNYIYQFGIISFIVYVLFIIKFYSYTCFYNYFSKYSKLIFISMIVYCFFENYLLNISSFLAIYCYTIASVSKLNFDKKIVV